MTTDTNVDPLLPYGNDPSGRKWRVRVTLAGLALFAVTSAYAAFAMLTQVDQLVLPGNEIRLPGIFEAPGFNVTPPGAIESEEDRINILLIGLDRRPGQEKSDRYRADSIMVISIHPHAKKGTMLSFPRDLWVQIPRKDGGFNLGRINEAYERGVSENFSGGAPGLMRATLKHNFGIEIDNYVVIDFEGFVRLIDALGGIDIEIPDRVAYPYSTDERPGSVRFFQVSPGKHHFNGDDALAYARYRNDSDLYRVQRQQRVIFAAIDRALSLNLLGNPISVWDKYHDAVKTDVSSFRAPGLAALVQGIGSKEIQAYSLGDAALGFSTPDGASLLRLLPEQGAPVIGAAFRPPAIQKENASVWVYDGARSPDLLNRTGLYLQLQGLAQENLVLTNPPAGSSYTSPAIIYRPKAKTTAKFIAKWLNMEKSLREASAQEAADLPGDVLVVIGPDTQPALVALPGTERGAAPASRFSGPGAPPQFTPDRPPPFSPLPVSPPTALPGPGGTAAPNPFAPPPTKTPTAAPNPFAGTPAPPLSGTPVNGFGARGGALN